MNNFADHCFQTIAKFYPTEKIASNKIIAGLWRVLFYTIRPKKPFVMSLPLYSTYVYPFADHTLTKVLIRRGYWEQAETDFYLKHLKKGGFVIDAGANFGHYTLTAAQVIGTEGLVIAFEPFPSNYDILKRNLSLLPHQNVLAEQAGLAANEGQLNLVVDNQNAGGHSFNPALVWEKKEEIAVPVHTVDLYLKKHKITRSLDILKIDTQGYEWQIIKGARDTILKDKPVVFCEIAPNALASIGDAYEDILSFFENLGYDMHHVDRIEQRIAPIAYETARIILQNKDPMYYEDMIFTPKK
jgi:FkbM family methyltransferase